jgi:hypothetical protein
MSTVDSGLGLLDWRDDSALEEERPIGLKIQRSDGVEKPRPQSIYIFDPGTGWLVEHFHDHQYPAKEVVARYRNSGRSERIAALQFFPFGIKLLLPVRLFP